MPIINGFCSLMNVKEKIEAITSESVRIITGWSCSALQKKKRKRKEKEKSFVRPWKLGDELTIYTN